MKNLPYYVTIGNFRDLSRFGIDCLTGEACGLSIRYLCDVTKQGHDILCCFWGLPLSTKFSDNWNSGDKDNPSIGSVMLAPDCLEKLAVFALKYCDYFVAAVMKNGVVVGFKEPSNADEEAEVHRWLDYARLPPMENRDILGYLKQAEGHLKSLNGDDEETNALKLNIEMALEYATIGQDLSRLFWLKGRPLRNMHQMSGRTE